MGPTLLQQFANAQSAYLDARKRKKPSRLLGKRMNALKARILRMETQAERKEARSK